MTNNEFYAKINDLWGEYDELSVASNTDSSRMKVRGDLLVTLYRFYNSGFRAPCFPSVELLETVDSCLHSFVSSRAKENGTPFSRYVCASVAKTLKKESEKLAFEQRYKGTLSDCDRLKIKKVKKLEQLYSAVGGENEREAIIAQAMNISAAQVRQLKELDKTSVLSDAQQSDEGEEYSLFDTLSDSHLQNPSEQRLLDKEESEAVLYKIQSEWEKKADALLRMLLTVWVLKDKGCASLLCELHSGGENPCQKYSFLSGDMLVAFFRDASYPLPTDSELAIRFGVTKSAASKKLNRFFEKLKPALCALR